MQAFIDRMRWRIAAWISPPLTMAEATPNGMPTLPVLLVRSGSGWTNALPVEWTAPEDSVVTHVNIEPSR